MLASHRSSFPPLPPPLVLPEQVVECSATDFVTGYANQSSGKTREMFEQAVGGVLFIDEAYR